MNNPEKITASRIATRLLLPYFKRSPMKHIHVIIIAIFSASCGQIKEQSQNENITEAENIITLTPAQYKAADIALGNIMRKPMGTMLRVNGMLDVPPQNLITIAAPMGGFVKSTKLLQGMKVKKGEALVTLENQEYIQLQQDYLDNRSKLEFSEAEYNRQVELAKENVNAQKSLQQSKSQYLSIKAAVKGLEAKLAMINIPASSLEDGNIRPAIQLYAPIDGYVTVVNVNIGQYVNATDVMFKIVNIEHIHVELQVYEKDIHKIKAGQKVSFQLSNENAIRTASVYLIGKEITPDRTVRIHCHLDKEDESLLPGMYVTAALETTKYETDVVPTSSLVNFEGKDYLFAATKGKEQFELIAVKTGNTDSEFTEVEIPSAFDKSRAIVLRGAFELLGVLKNTAEE
jgi:membrane fusion protein, heavy metal efflux system